MLLCYEVETGVDACGLARGSTPLHLEGSAHMTPVYEAVTCKLCLAAIAMQLV